MPDLPHVQTVRTPPGSVLVVHVAPEDAEGTFTLAEELHRQTGLPVVVVTPGAELSVTTPEEAEAALALVLGNAEADWTGAPGLPRDLLSLLRGEGWELVRLRQP